MVTRSDLYIKKATLICGHEEDGLDNKFWIGRTEDEYGMGEEMRSKQGQQLWRGEELVKSPGPLVRPGPLSSPWLPQNAFYCFKKKKKTILPHL